MTKKKTNKIDKSVDFIQVGNTPIVPSAITVTQNPPFYITSTHVPLALKRTELLGSAANNILNAVNISQSIDSCNSQLAQALHDINTFCQDNNITLMIVGKKSGK